MVAFFLDAASASAYYETPAGVGFPANAADASRWTFTSVDGVMHLGAGLPSALVIPIQFASGPVSPFAWSVSVWASGGAWCRLYTIADGTTLPSPIVSDKAGPFTDPSKLDIPPVTVPPWTSTYQAAYLYCSVPGGGWIGNVRWGF
jgi:hypothetical protein